MSRKVRLDLICMVALLTLALSGTAWAVIEPPDPLEPDYGPVPMGDAVYADQSIVADSTTSGLITLFPGDAGCSVVFFGSHIRFDVNVLPNLGTDQGYDHNPKAKITVWRANNASMGNAVVLDRTKRTGMNAFSASYNGTGFYQICFRYPAAQAVAPGSAFDRMNIELFVNWR